MILQSSGRFDRAGGGAAAANSDDDDDGDFSSLVAGDFRIFVLVKRVQ